MSSEQRSRSGLRPSWIEIHLAALGRNIIALKELVHPAKFCAVVKADAYGHGAVPVSQTALASGVDQLAVALVSEGIELRQAGVEAPILILSQPTVPELEEALRWHLVPTFYHPAYAEMWVDLGGKDLQLKLDTGMHRVGADFNSIYWLARRIESTLGGKLDGVWSHLAVAGSDPEFSLVQLRRFSELLTALQEAGINPGTTHLANSAAAITMPDTRMDMVRIGLGMYGLHPHPSTQQLINLEPVMSVKSQVTHIRRLSAEHRISYGRRYQLSTDSNIVTIPIGYADGVPFRLGKEGTVLVGGKPRSIAGSVTMDMIMADLGSDPVKMGDEVVLIGSQADQTISADQWAARVGSINYEIVTRMGKRLPRSYIS